GQQHQRAGERGLSHSDDAHAGHAGSDEEVEAQRWCDHADLQVHHDDDAEVDRVDPQLRCDRQQDRSEDEDRRGRLHHTADEQQEDIDEDEELPRLQVPFRDRGRDLTRNPLAGEYKGEEDRSEEHTSELQSRFDLVCRLLLEKKKITAITKAASAAHATHARYSPMCLCALPALIHPTLSIIAGFYPAASTALLDALSLHDALPISAGGY